MDRREPTVIVVLTPKGLEKAFVFYQEDDAEALEAGNRLLARVSMQLTLIDNELRMENNGCRPKARAGD